MTHRWTRVLVCGGRKIDRFPLAAITTICS